MYACDFDSYCESEQDFVACICFTVDSSINLEFRLHFYFAQSLRSKSNIDL